MLEIKDLQIGNGGVAGVHLMPLGDHRLGEVVRPIAFVFLDLLERRAKAGIIRLCLAIASRGLEDR